MGRGRLVKMNFGLKPRPLTAVEPQFIHNFGFDRLEVVERLLLGHPFLIPDVQTDGFECLAPRITAIPMSTVCGPAVPEPIGDWLGGDSHIYRAGPHMNHIELRSRVGRPAAESASTERLPDPEALSR